MRAAIEALDREDVERVLPYVPKDGEDEMRHAFELVMKARVQGPEAREVADRFFFETTVRIHRAGEGAPFTGLKPAGLDVGPVIPIAEHAIENETPEPLIEFFVEHVQAEIADRYAAMAGARKHAEEGTDQARAYISAMLGLQVWAHKLFGALHSDPHGHGASHAH